MNISEYIQSIISDYEEKLKEMKEFDKTYSFIDEEDKKKSILCHGMLEANFSMVKQILSEKEITFIPLATHHLSNGDNVIDSPNNLNVDDEVIVTTNDKGIAHGVIYDTGRSYAIRICGMPGLPISTDFFKYIAKIDTL